MNGGEVMPAALRTILSNEMATWQYYERDSIISISDSGEKARNLIVQSVDDSGSKMSGAQRSHFAVAMFSEVKAPEAI